MKIQFEIDDKLLLESYTNSNAKCNFDKFIVDLTEMSRCMLLGIIYEGLSLIKLDKPVSDN